MNDPDTTRIYAIGRVIHRVTATICLAIYLCNYLAYKKAVITEAMKNHYEETRSSFLTSIWTYQRK